LDVGAQVHVGGGQMGSLAEAGQRRSEERVASLLQEWTHLAPAKVANIGTYCDAGMASAGDEDEDESGRLGVHQDPRLNVQRLRQFAEGAKPGIFAASLEAHDRYARDTRTLSQLGLSHELRFSNATQRRNLDHRFVV
jgi:hypothetical protein